MKTFKIFLLLMLIATAGFSVPTVFFSGGCFNYSMFSKQIILHMSSFDHALIQGDPLNKAVIWISDGTTVTGPIP